MSQLHNRRNKVKRLQDIALKDRQWHKVAQATCILRQLAERELTLFNKRQNQLQQHGN
jgi:hypothetical protein